MRRGYPQRYISLAKRGTYKRPLNLPRSRMLATVVQYLNQLGSFIDSLYIMVPGTLIFWMLPQTWTLMACT